MHIQVTIHSFGAISRELPKDLCLNAKAPILVEEIVQQLEHDYPNAQQKLQRCACAIETDLIARQHVLLSNTTLVLLSPVAGG